MNKKEKYILKVAKHLASHTKIVPLSNKVYDRYEYGAYGLIYPFLDSEDIYYVGTLEHGNAVIRNDLTYYVNKLYGVAEHEMYDLVDVYKTIVYDKLKKLAN
tara:strand:- start:2419 stop:2724 length:306 start_codon:yes stop_codon:yes gene_type:complete